MITTTTAFFGFLHVAVHSSDTAMHHVAVFWVGWMVGWLVMQKGWT